MLNEFITIKPGGPFLSRNELTVINTLKLPVNFYIFVPGFIKTRSARKYRIT